MDEAGSALYTNVYIIAYNVGARPDTISIASQLINNILLNINIDQGVNICFTEDTRICSSDFDCPGECQGNPDLSPEECADLPEIWVADSCQALGDKLRRDTQRLGNLLSIKNAIEDYGQSHKACSNNNTISCNTDADCPGGACWQFYPLLNAGTYIDGMSTTGWPSWQETLSPVLLSSIQDDPINLFNGCPSETDPNTCWNETDLEFICPDKSLIYLYNSLSGGTDYYLGANFEYDQTSPTVNFRNHLFNGPDPLGIDGTGAIMGNIYSNLNDMTVPIEHRYCDDTSITSPGGSTSPHCGDSFVDDPPEECDGNTRDYMCDEFLGEQDWWDEQTLGCYPSGSLDWICEDGGGNRLPIYNEDDCVAPNNWVYQIMECRWFEYELTSEICGGYCGDGALQPFYESCESCTGNGDGSADCNGVLYTCGDGLDPFCHPDSCMPMCNDGSAASACGDGEWNPLNEQCDWSAEPPADGVYGWDCTEGGNITCNSFCEHECDPSGDPYFGICGDGLVDPVNEECDPLNHGPISPDESGIDNQYACTDECEDTGGYCGDTELQYSDGEYCDFDTDTGNYNIGYDGEVPPSPPDTSENEQYICQSDPAAIYDICTMTAGGYCGDEIRQLVYGEYCDCGNDPWCGGGGYPDGPANPGASSIDLQYECTSSGLNACLTSTGGYCGDGIFDDGGDNTYRYDHGNNHLEECDDGDADNFNLCSNICTWNCTDPNDAFNNRTDNVTLGNPDMYAAATSSFTLDNGCRESGDMTVFIDPEGGAVGGSNGVMFITDLSGSMQICMNDELPDGTCTGGGLCSVYNDGNDIGNEPISNYIDCINPANGCTWTWNNTCEGLGSISRINTVVDAIAGPGGALDTIFTADPDANVALASFGENGYLDEDFGLGLADLQAVVEGYESRAYEWGTDHAQGILQANAIAGGDWGFTDKRIIFMTDGLYSPVGTHAINEAESLRSNGFDIFTVLLWPDFIGDGDGDGTNDAYELAAYMNGLSSSGCSCVDDDCRGSASVCGAGSVRCASEDYAIFEECESGDPSCNVPICQPIDSNDKRAYQAFTAGDMVDMYEAIAESLPVSEIRLTFTGSFADLGTFPIEGLEDDGSDVVIDMSGLNTFDWCEEDIGIPLLVPFRLDFVADPAVHLLFSNARYNYCPWEN